jgi:phage repressor protein C with HTH and peptisase S24 domain
MRRLVRSWRRRVAVDGHSMEPSLRPGDWLLVDPEAYRHRPAVRGELVVAVDPREPSRLLIKRVAQVLDEGRLTLAGDHPAHTHDRLIVAAGDVVGRPWLRYWPPPLAIIR